MKRTLVDYCFDASAKMNTSLFREQSVILTLDMPVIELARKDCI